LVDKYKLNKATYSIIYISPDSRLGDRVAIGMLIFKHDKLIYRFSDEKLKSLKSILGSKGELIRKSLSLTQKYIENIDTNKNPIFNEARNIVSESYLEKLSVYSNGIIQYQKPTLAILTDTFDENHLYSTLFPSTIEIKKEDHKDEFKQIIESDFLGKVKDQIHIKIEIDYNIIPDLYFQFFVLTGS
jgi:hypothetical protein